MIMEKKFTQKDFPIQSIWLLKPLLWPIGIILVLLFGEEYLEKRPNTKKTGLPAKYLIIIFAVTAIVDLIYNILKRKKFSFSFEEHTWDLKQGIIAKSERHFLYTNLQNIFVKQDIFDRIFGLGSLVIEDAAGIGRDSEIQKKSQKRLFLVHLGFTENSITIPGLKIEDAIKLKDLILQKFQKHSQNETSGL